MAFSVKDGDEDAPMSEINVTPLVDVMLVLLIVFMITMPVLTHSIQMNLPVASKQQEQKTDPEKIKPIRLQISAQGDYVLGTEDNRPLSLDALKQKLQALAQTQPEAIVAISADKNVSYDHVAKALDVARAVKLSKVAFEMEEHSPTP